MKYGILNTLVQYGVRGNLGLFIANFFSGRQFRVKVVATFSDTFPQELGVPQGSVLSCTLFLLSMNDVTNSLPEGVSATVYVDDLTIYLTSSFTPSTCRIL